MTAEEREKEVIKKKRAKTIDELHAKYYGSGSKHSKKHAQKAQVEARVKAKQSGDPDAVAKLGPVGISRADLMDQAKKKGIKNFRVLNKAELEEAVKPSTSQERIKAIVTGAVARWKAGWSSGKGKGQ